MIPPPLLLGATVAFWGYQTGQITVALIVAAALEAPQLVKSRWEVSPVDFRRLVALCSVLFTLVIAYFVITASTRDAVTKVLQWLPLILLPLIVAQRYAVADRLDPSALFLLLRQREGQRSGRGSGINLGYPYFALCLLAGSAAEIRTPWFYAGSCILAIWALWPLRTRGYPIYLWFGLMALAGATGFAGHLGLNHLQQWVINAGVDLLAGGGTRTDPYRSMTGLGHIGTLKLSDRILLRVAIEGDLPRPLLLHRATYNQYVYRNWIAREAPLAPIKPDGDGVSWTFQNQTVPGKAVTVSTYLERGLGVLALPTDLSRLSRLPVTVLKKNRLGTIRVEGESGFTRYQALIGDRISLMDVPTGDDLQIPEQEQPVVMQAVRELDLVGGAPEKILESVANYFSDNFQYSLAQRGEQSGTPLNDFLTRSRAGHCEYFATATVLLLRAAGIPARYATGFSVQEYSNLEEVYLVRQRHAHAWALAYVNGGWRNVDNTPSSWYDVERDNAAAWEPLMDLWWWARYRFSTWSKEGDVRELVLIAFSPIVLVGFFFLWRWLSKRRRTAGRDRQAVAKSQAWPGRDSPFYRIMHRLRGEGLEQRPEEPLTAWVERLSSSGSGLPQAQQLREIVHLHYRYRFHAQGLSREEKATLDDQVNEWLENWEVQAR